MQGWCQEFSDGGESSDEGLNMAFRVLEMPKISEKISFHLPMGGLACSDGGYSLPSPTLDLCNVIQQY